MSWATIKKNQANDANRLAAVASGIGEYGIANACYSLAAILRAQAKIIDEQEKREKVIEHDHAHRHGRGDPHSHLHPHRNGSENHDSPDHLTP